jgi:tellurite resistance protein TerC
MIAGASWIWWIGFHAVAAALLVMDWLLAGRGRRLGRERSFAWLGVGLMALAAAAFAGWMMLAHGRQAALEFAAGYTIEVSMSIDNLFVFLVLFQGFEISRERQQKALLWGVGGAAVLRALFIAAGFALLGRFDWIRWMLGFFLIYATTRVVWGQSARAAIPEWIRKLQPARGSLVPVILAVEATDILFATDSIPAVLAVTHSPFVAYTSNIAAVVGLRSLYFALAAALERFKYLHYGLGAILAFAGLKILAEPWVQTPVTVSLGVMAGILAVCAAAEAMRKQRAKVRPRV